MNAQRRGIAVGVDGSPESMVGAVWAAQEATRRGLSLLIVHGFTDPAVDYLSGGALRQGLDELMRGSIRVLEEAKSTRSSASSWPGTPTSTRTCRSGRL